MASQSFLRIKTEEAVRKLFLPSSFSWDDVSLKLLQYMAPSSLPRSMQVPLPHKRKRDQGQGRRDKVVNRRREIEIETESEREVEIDR